jgi:hypothetical protein
VKLDPFECCQHSVKLQTELLTRNGRISREGVEGPEIRGDLRRLKLLYLLDGPGLDKARKEVVLSHLCLLFGVDLQGLLDSRQKVCRIYLAAPAKSHMQSTLSTSAAWVQQTRSHVKGVSSISLACTEFLLQNILSHALPPPSVVQTLIPAYPHARLPFPLTHTSCSTGLQRWLARVLSDPALRCSFNQG